MILFCSLLLAALILISPRFLMHRAVKSPFELACAAADNSPMSKTRWITPKVTYSTKHSDRTTLIELQLSGSVQIICMSEDGVESRNQMLLGAATLRLEDPDLVASGFADVLRNYPDNISVIEVTRYGLTSTTVTLETIYGFLHTLTTEELL